MKILNYIFIPENCWILEKFSTADVKHYKAPEGFILEVKTKNNIFNLGKSTRVAINMGHEIYLFAGEVAIIEKTPYGYRTTLIEKFQKKTKKG
jgi:hypothetical protein